MNYIYKYIDTNINIDELCLELNISKFHLHRIFKEEFGRNIYESIKAIRLQKASSLLITNRHSTITQIAKMCGYSSQTSFIRTFKERFLMTPKQWRNNGYLDYSNKILQTSLSANDSNATFYNQEPTVVKMPDIEVYYLRHQGYDKSIKKTWQKLQVWAMGHNFENFRQIGLHHDNPILNDLKQCQYVACIELNEEDKKKPINSSVPKVTIPSGVYAKFNMQGKYGDVLKLIQWVYHTWLIESGYETTTHPSFAIYERNHFLEKDEHFILEYYVPIALR
jgi:AraC family transcriptional regulator